MAKKICTVCKKGLSMGKFHRDSTKKDGLRNRCKTCRNIEFKKKRIEATSLISSLKDNGCSICGYNKCLEALHFHHVNPEEKRYSVGNMKYHRIETILKEVQKCILVCANCHYEIEKKEEQKMNNKNEVMSYTH